MQIVAEARRFLGDPYVFGAAGPATFDCSGLVQYTLSKLGIHGVPRTSEAQWGWVQRISRAQLQPGDLIFEQWPGDQAAPGHVVIYAGGGKVIEAPRPGQSVQIRSWSPSETTVIGYGRIPGASYKGEPAGSAAGSGGGGLSLLSLPADVLSMFSAGEDFLRKIMWILNPENWARIVAGLFGFFLLAFGIGFLVAAA